MSDTKFDKLRQGGWSYRKFTTAAAEPKLWTGYITESGTHYPPGGYDGFNAVVVEVPASGDAKGLIEGGVEYPTVPEDIEKIGAYKFYGDKVLKEVGYISYLSEIGPYAFYDCSNLSAIDFGTVETIGAHAFENCTSLTTSWFPSYIGSIGESAFNGCSGLGDIVLHDIDQISIEKNAFANCENLGYVQMYLSNPTMSNIDSTAFANCPSIQTIDVSWSEGEVAGAPWGATNAEVRYNIEMGG